MAIPKKILKYLDTTKTGYKIINHKTVYTAYDTAQTLGVKLNEIAKTLVVKADRDYILAVVPASHRLDLGKLKKIAKAKKVEIAKENIMNKLFKIKPGAVTPFGAIYKVPVFVDKSFGRVKNIIAGAGTYRDSVTMTSKNFFKATGGVTGDFSKKK